MEHCCLSLCCGVKVLNENEQCFVSSFLSVDILPVLGLVAAHHLCRFLPVIQRCFEYSEFEYQVTSTEYCTSAVINAFVKEIARNRCKK